MRAGVVIPLLCLCAAASPALAEVIELTDANFEHDTQAASGQTTGVWFVEFYSPNCGACLQLEPVWEALAEELRPEGVLVARVDVSANRGVGTRFAAAGLLKSVPTTLLFRDRRVYATTARHQESLAQFARKGFRASEAFEVPPEPSAWERIAAQGSMVLRALAQIIVHYLNQALGSTAVRGLQRLPLGRGAGGWRVWAIQYPTSVYLLGGLAVAGVVFLGLLAWLVFGMQPLEGEGEEEGGAPQAAAAGGGERKKDR